MLGNYDKFKEIKVEKQNGIINVMLNNPENSNPTTWTLEIELKEVWQIIREDSEVRAVIFSGAGPDFSCVRPNTIIHPPADDPPHPLLMLESAGPAIFGNRPGHMSMLKYLLEVPQPIIAVVQGRCSGMATTLVLHCDIVIAANDAQISDPHIARGIVPGDGGAVIWPLLVGPARAKEYLMTGDSISGAEAQRIGLINRAVPTDELNNTALALAKRLVAGPPLAIRFTKHAINRIISHQLELVWELADAYQILTLQTEDYKEAKTARMTDRPPQFTGR